MRAWHEYAGQYGKMFYVFVFPEENKVSFRTARTWVDFDFVEAKHICEELLEIINKNEE